MAYVICKICGKMFKKDGNEYCDTCGAESKKEYDLVVDYIANHPDHIILDIITETGVSVKSINRFIEEGSISYKDESS